MEDPKKYMHALFALKGMQVQSSQAGLFEKFAAEEENNNAVLVILEKQKMLMAKWEITTRINTIIGKHVSIPNGTVGKTYEAQIVFSDWGLTNLDVVEFVGLEPLGLSFDKDTDKITGIPVQSGDHKVKLKFRLQEESDSTELHDKPVTLIINPDPKSLWKDRPSEEGSLFWKKDNDSTFQSLGNRHVVVASRRGRSHANVGSYRDDDFAVKYLPDSGWSIIVVSDGAGGYPVTRKGSQLACNAVVDYFEQYFTPAKSAEADNIIKEHQQAETEETKKKLNGFLSGGLVKAARYAHDEVAAFAKENERPIKDFHATLIFALFKKYDFGYVVLSFGVGDCPIAVLYKENDEDHVTLMNQLDVGEFGGGTRFITMPEIFTDERFGKRFNYKIFPDFSYLMLMTDGIYDPKFVVEANLEKVEKWKEFVQDLQGKNEDGAKVEFDAANTAIADQLSKWMDFWSTGNHDDRTLAVVF